MRLFQKPPRTAEEIARGRPLDLPPAEVAQMDEETWRARAFRGEEAPQLTIRAIAMGSALGGLLALTNVYVGLKAGWAVPVNLTACILSFAIWNALLRIGLARSPLSILETNCMQSTASSAGYSTGAVMVSAIPALLVLSTTATNPRGEQPGALLLVGWTFFTALLGVCLAIPMKRSLIDDERLPFPSGMAAATLLQSLYGSGSEALTRARALAAAALVAGVGPLLMDLRLGRDATGERTPLLPADSPIFDWLPARGVDPRTGAALAPSDWTMLLDHKLALVGGGVLVGLRVSASMVAGGLLLAYALGPAALAAGAAKGPGTAWREIGLWLGAPMMVAAGLTAFALRGPTILRALRGIRTRPLVGSELEVPGSWFVAGTAVAGLAIAAIGHASFGIPWPMGLLAVALTFVLSLVAARATGETDVTPTGPLGKIVQLTYGILLPQNASANLMTAAITANASTAAADLLTDLKAGRALGAHPRRQFVAQLAGIFAGTAATVAGYYVLVPDATALVGERPRFPAPAMQQWLAVARLFSEGLSHLHPMARQAIGGGVALGVALTLLERLAPRARRWLPSATGLGIGFIFPFQYPLSFFVGALGAAIWRRRREAAAERFAIPIASGLIAGESIVGVLVAAVNNLL
jgi:uncharacterized oligopeptide transporter (OPT) family protein